MIEVFFTHGTALFNRCDHMRIPTMVLVKEKDEGS